MHRLTLEDRKAIEKMLNEGYSQVNIARAIGVGKSTIGYELCNNTINGTYEAESAHSACLERRKSGPYANTRENLRNMQTRIEVLEQHLQILFEQLTKDKP